MLSGQHTADRPHNFMVERVYGTITKGVTFLGNKFYFSISIFSVFEICKEDLYPVNKNCLKHQTEKK